MVSVKGAPLAEGESWGIAIREKEETPRAHRTSQLQAL